MAACLDDAELAAFVEGRLDGAAFEAAKTHTESCDECQRLVGAYSGAFGVAATASSSSSSSGDTKQEEERYKLIAVLGTGAMGIVHHAHDSSLDRPVALKVLRRGLGIEDERLVREARAMAKLRHPNTVTVFDAGRLADGTAFVAMELVEGTTLREWLSKEQRTREEQLRVFAQAARGLAAAHALGIVHRDFKPDNVLVTTDGANAKVADFGLARAIGSSSSESSSLSGPQPPQEKREETKLTAHGTLVGTPAYMAPEQHDGREADARADQFAFFVALYEAIAGKRPFDGETPKDVRAAIARGLQKRDGTPDGLPSAVPGRLRALIAKGLEEKPARRHVSMDEVASILEELATPKRRPIAAAAAVVVAILVFAAILVLNRRGAEEDASIRNAAAAKGLSPECRALANKLALGVTKEEEAAVAAAFDKSQEPHAVDARNRFLGIVRDRIHSIANARGETCGGMASTPGRDHEGLESRGEVECLQLLLDDAHAIVGYARKVSSRAGIDGSIVAARSIESPAICRGALPDPTTDGGGSAKHDHDDGIERMLFELPLETAPAVASVEAPATKSALLDLVRVLRVRVRDPAAFSGEAGWDELNDAMTGLPGQIDRMLDEQKRAADIAAQHAFAGRDAAAPSPAPAGTTIGGKTGVPALLSRALASAEVLRLEALRAEILLLRAENDGNEPSEELAALVARASTGAITSSLELLRTRRAAYEGRVVRMPSLDHALALDLPSRAPFADALLARNEFARDQLKSEIAATVATAEAAWGPWHARTAFAHVQTAEWMETRGLPTLAEESSRRAIAILQPSVASPSRNTGVQSLHLARALVVLASTATEVSARDQFLSDADRLAGARTAAIPAILARTSLARARYALDHGDAKDAMAKAADVEKGGDWLTRVEGAAVLAEAAYEMSQKNPRAAGPATSGDRSRDASAPFFAKALASASLLAPRDRARLRLAAARRLSAPPRNPADVEVARALAAQAAEEATDPTAVEAAQTLLRSLTQ